MDYTNKEIMAASLPRYASEENFETETEKQTVQDQQEESKRPPKPRNITLNE